MGDLEAVRTLDALNVFDEDAALRRELNLSGPRGGAFLDFFRAPGAS